MFVNFHFGVNYPIFFFFFGRTSAVLYIMVLKGCSRTLFGLPKYFFSEQILEEPFYYFSVKNILT